MFKRLKQTLTRGPDGRNSSVLQRYCDSVGLIREDHAMVVVYGKSGAGKTATIMQLFGHCSKDKFPEGLQVSDKRSQTRETVEYILSMEQQKGEGKEELNSTTLGIVDTPGHEDTDGPEQDARNAACIKEFLLAHEALNQGTGIRRYPNVVLFVIHSADCNRFEGNTTQLSKGLNNLKHLKLTDFSNLVIVLTHAMNIAEDEAEWSAAANRIKNGIHQETLKFTGRSIPVVFLENKFFKRMPMVNDWRVLPDGTQQPRNLFIEIQTLLELKDLVGRIAIREFFARSSKNSNLRIRTGLHCKASLRGSGPLNKMEEDFYRFITGEATKEHYEHAEDTEQPQSSEAIESIIIEKCDSQPSLQEPQNDFSRIREFMQSEYYAIGRGFDVRKGEMMQAQIFKSKVLKEAFDITSHCETKQEDSTDKDNNNKKILGMGSVGDAKLAGSYIQINHCESFIMNLKVTRAKITPKLYFRQKVWHKRDSLDKKFLSELTSLPNNYIAKENYKKFERFFKRHGVGFTWRAFGGGQLRIELALSEASSEMGGVKAPHTNTIVSMDELPVVLSAFGFTLSPGRNATNSSSTFQLRFSGGLSVYHKAKSVEEWKDSLENNPVIFLLDPAEDVTLYCDFVRELDWLKSPEELSTALSQAYEDFCTGVMLDRKGVAALEEKKDETIATRIWNTAVNIFSHQPK